VWSTNFDYHHSCWWHSIFLHQYPIADANHRGWWTQMFGGKASKMQTSWPVEKCILTYPTCIWHPRWVWSHQNFLEILCIIILESLDCGQINNYVHVRGRTYIHTCWTYVHTPHDFTDNASLAWRLRWHISTVMFTCGWAWPARWLIHPILGFWGSKVHKNGRFPALDADEPPSKIWCH